MSLQKRPQRSFTPTSDDGDLVVPAPNQNDTDTPSPENTPLIRKPVGFTWTPSTSAHIETYEASLPPKPPTAGYFLPGQAPLPPPKPPKPPKPKTNRKKKNQEYSSQTGRFRLTATPGPSTTPPALPDFLSLTPSGGTGLAGAISFHSSAAIMGSPGGTISSGSSVVAASPSNVSAQLSFGSTMAAANGLTHYGHEMPTYGTTPAQVGASTSLAPPRKRPKRSNKITEGTTPDVQAPQSPLYQRSQETNIGLAPHISHDRRGSSNQAESTETINTRRSPIHSNLGSQSNTSCKKIFQFVLPR